MTGVQDDITELRAQQRERYESLQQGADVHDRATALLQQRLCSKAWQVDDAASPVPMGPRFASELRSAHGPALVRSGPRKVSRLARARVCDSADSIFDSIGRLQGGQALPHAGGRGFASGPAPRGALRARRKAWKRSLTCATHHGGLARGLAGAPAQQRPGMGRR